MGDLGWRRLTLADISVASPVAEVGHMNLVMAPARYRRTISYTHAILARPSFAANIARESMMLTPKAA